MNETNSIVGESEADVEPNDTVHPLHSPLEILVPFLSFYWTPVISIAGILANTVTLVILTRPFVVASSWVIYIMGIVIAEILHLVTRLDRWAAALGLDLYGRIGGWCQLLTFLSGAAEFLILWYAVCLGADRVVRHLPPTPITKVMTSLTFARTGVVLLSIVAIIVYINTSITFGEVKYEHMATTICMALGMFESVLFRLESVGAFVNSALPLVLLSSFELFIGISLVIKTRRSHVRLPQCSADNATASLQDTTSESRETDRSIANTDADRTAFFFLLFFLLTNLPIHLFNDFYVISSLAAGRNLGMGLWQYLMQRVLEELKNTNEALSFLLLVSTSPDFRDALLRTRSALCRKEQQTQRQNNGIEFSV